MNTPARFMLLAIEIVSPVVAMHESLGGNTDERATNRAERGSERAGGQADNAPGDGAGGRGAAGRRVLLVVGLGHGDVTHLIHIWARVCTTRAGTCVAFAAERDPGTRGPN